mmetsp:Transcript_78533/g.139298  ORF Transcript_78533/g.139298 Transcript_78533/m.139298 type:complete len:293 (-) Transcript_78533:313-1191(-)
MLWLKQEKPLATVRMLVSSVCKLFMVALHCVHVLCDIVEDGDDALFHFSCWVDELEYFSCCDPKYGPQGHSTCFNNVFTFDRCCIEQEPQDDGFSCWGLFSSRAHLSVDACCSASSKVASDNTSCWDDFFTYDACCKRQEFELPPLGDTAVWTSPTAVQLQELEQNFGGLQTGVSSKGCETNQTGGDRMSRALHNYAPCYARLLAKMLPHWHDSFFSVAEIGILSGSGLALWSRVFPMARLLGFDIDTSNALGKLEFMKSRGGSSLMISCSPCHSMRRSFRKPCKDADQSWL